MLAKIFLDGRVEFCEFTKDNVNEADEKNNRLSKSDAYKYIAEHGLTKEMFELFGEYEIFESGGSWAYEKLLERSKNLGIRMYDLWTHESWTENDILSAECILYTVNWFEFECNDGGLRQYVQNDHFNERQRLLKILYEIGALKTAKVIEKTLKNRPNYAKLEEEMIEDYIGLTIAYLKKQQGKSGDKQNRECGEKE
jgi:hypothetical protein